MILNPSGSLKSKGYPIGATGVSMHIMASMQLMGEAGDMQIPGAALAGVYTLMRSRLTLRLAGKTKSGGNGVRDDPLAACAKLAWVP